MDSNELIVNSSESGILQLILNRPAQLNAWTPALEAAFFATLDAAATDPDVRVVVVTGAGRGFCAGASFDILGEAAASNDRTGRRELCELAEFPKPVIAAINGPAAGLGFVLALWCDIRIAAADAKLTTSFARLGLVAEHGAAWLLPRLVGRTHATDLLLSGHTLTGTQAESIGLVNRTVEAGKTLSAAMDYARELIRTGAPNSWATIKRQLVDAEQLSLRESYTQATELMIPALASADHREGVAAWRDKRTPRFEPFATPSPRR
ncbi:enoyl-CoA hydratase-related protein [Nocardia miyunensis]|uniref:enoyl-CoA hydratase-related protein n=1 Tax=Nocardia miyunensis TaxID=282684 RepID=UPI00082AB643|nr:enoyl-CoA hydratase-related protein [Nocardia miyunensis]